MEDRFLFRAKRKDNGEWIFGNLIQTDDGVYIIQNYVPQHLIKNYEVDPATVCQCTGLEDKNGNLIWENDIIECKDGKHNFQTQIEWDAYCAGFIFQDTETSVVGLDAITANGLYSESKVVSNIFDNQELLEVRL